ncbi:MAG: endosialidase [Firmicutes bacterium HGW-Firmicutes-7]|nr:MAG: endosialidase [Firmicutes bacterium HGW-Firmicutes-7]
MAGIEELIRVEDQGAISFGNYLADSKQKKQDFEVDGDVYKVKTYSSMTRLEKNSRLLYESIPGTTVYNFSLDEKELSFIVEGVEDAQITVELETEQEYKIYIDQMQLGKMKSNLAGKLNLSVDFSNGKQNVVIKKV